MDRVLAELIRIWATRLEDEITYVAAKIGQGEDRALDGLDALLDDMHRTVHTLEESGRRLPVREPALVR